MTLISTLAVVFGSLMAVANFPQACKIFSRKSAKDISLITYLLLWTGGLVWIVYGVELQNFAILLTYSIGTVVISLVLVGWWRYH